MGGLSLERWSLRSPLACRQPDGNPQLGVAHQAGERGPEVDGGDRVVWDVWRLVGQALADCEIKVVRVGNKASHDYAEVFDGVPSQHDGKDAAVVAELAALGKSTPWDYRPADAWEQELAYWVEWMVAHRQALTIWQGRLEGLVGRHWPEATQVLKLSSVTLLRALKHYGSPQALAADPQAAQQLARWGGRFLEPKKIRQLVDNANSSVGVRAAEWQQRQIRDYAQQALAARAGGPAANRRLYDLAAENVVLQAQGKVVGVPTACVLWTSTGDPRKYHAAAAYRKAMGLNLVERSSGKYKGRLRISKRGMLGLGSGSISPCCV